jgi:ribosome-binding factor A
MPGPKRSVRVAGQLKVALAELLSREVADPRLAGVVVTRTEMTDDLGMLTAHVRMLTTTDDAAARKETLVALRNASGMFKRELVRRVRLRTVPQLRFFYDDGQDRQSRVEELLREIDSEKRSHEGTKP